MLCGITGTLMLFLEVPAMISPSLSTCLLAKILSPGFFFFQAPLRALLPAVKFPPFHLHLLSSYSQCLVASTLLRFNAHG